MPVTLVELADAGPGPVVPIHPVTMEGLDPFLGGLASDRAGRARAWTKASGFTGAPNSHCLVPGADGTPDLVLLGCDPGVPEGRIETATWTFGGLVRALQPGTYAIAPPDLDPATRRAFLTDAAIGWRLGGYEFPRYRKSPGLTGDRRLVWPEDADRPLATATADAVHLVRDLINTPANDMGPAELAEAATALAHAHNATVTTLVGAELLANNYPAIHAVGRASSREPRLIDMTWGSPSAPKVTLVGKGVVFDTGGLDLKPAAGMKLMKKDMGGAAQVLGIASIIMALNVPVRLRVLIPAVENAVSGDAFRPLDILRTRKGLTVEVGNTDAEGRIVLADALAEACAERPAMLVDFATLTGAARVALGPDVPAMFSNDEALAAGLTDASARTNDPIWRLPLHQPYRRSLDSSVADLNNAAAMPYAGAITAALFLEAFVEPGIPWAHFDVMAWNTANRPGRPEGGEAMGVRAVADLIRQRFAE